MLRRLAASRSGSLLKQLAHGPNASSAAAAAGASQPGATTATQQTIWSGPAATFALGQSAILHSAARPCGTRACLLSSLSRTAASDHAPSGVSGDTTTPQAVSGSGSHVSSNISWPRRALSTLGPPPQTSLPGHHPNKESEDDAAGAAGAAEQTSADGRQAASQTLSEQLEEQHGPPLPPPPAVHEDDDLRLGSAIPFHASSIAEASVVLQVHIGSVITMRRFGIVPDAALLQQCPTVVQATMRGGAMRPTLEGCCSECPPAGASCVVVQIMCGLAHANEALRALCKDRSSVLRRVRRVSESVLHSAVSSCPAAHECGAPV